MIETGTLVLDGRFRVLQLLGSAAWARSISVSRSRSGARSPSRSCTSDLIVHAQHDRRFKREARLLSAVDHPAVVRVIDFGEASVGACR